MSRILCIQEERRSSSRVYLQVPDEVSVSEVISRLAEHLSPDNKPYEALLYVDGEARFRAAVESSGLTLVDTVETITLSELMRDAPKAPSCGGWHVGLNSKADMLRLAAFLNAPAGVEDERALI